MFAFDLTWVSVFANSFYRSQLGYLYSPHTLWWAAILFYIIYVLGLSYFVIAPAVRDHSLPKGIRDAAFFGLVAYGTYDLTSLATTTNWPFLMTFVDMAWGVVCAAVVTIITYYIAMYFYVHKESHPMVIPESTAV